MLLALCGGLQKVRVKMILEIDANGLPKPGRKLDYFIATRVLKQSPPDTSHADVFTDYEWFQVGAYHWERKSPDDFEHPGMYPVRVWPEYYSTTHAYHSVMDAMEAVWSFSERYNVGGETKKLRCLLWIPDGDGWITHEIGLELADYPDREHAYAHAVCAAAWMAMGGNDEMP
jgi:hypothetical protein